MTEHDVTRHEHGQHGEYRIAVPGVATPARLTWVLRPPLAGAAAADPVRVAEHTLVPRELEGQGLAAQLVHALIADAQDQGFRIVPQCSYVAAQFARHPEWAALRA